MDVSQGKFKVDRQLDGRIRISCPPLMLLPPQDALKVAMAILKICGVTTVMAEPGQTVIRPPAARKLA